MRRDTAASPFSSVHPVPKNQPSAPADGNRATFLAPCRDAPRPSRGRRCRARSSGCSAHGLAPEWRAAGTGPFEALAVRPNPLSATRRPIDPRTQGNESGRLGISDVSRLLEPGVPIERGVATVDISGKPSGSVACCGMMGGTGRRWSSPSGQWLLFSVLFCGFWCGNETAHSYSITDPVRGDRGTGTEGRR